MKELLTTIVIGLIVNVHALNMVAPEGGIIDHPKASLTLKFKQSTGTNASSVTYNPKAKLYYSCIAGNRAYPLEVFDINGKNVFQTTTGVDLRGLWWNNKSKSLEGNCYGTGGIVSFPLSKKATPFIGVKTLLEGADHQPGKNSCGVYDSKKKQVLYYNYGYAVKYTDGEKVETLKLSIPNISHINSESLIYTGKKSMELGVLDYINKKVYLFNKKTGEKSATITLPADAITHSVFRFAYANNYVFLYNTESRSLTGYQIFM